MKKLDFKSPCNKQEFAILYKLIELLITCCSINRKHELFTISFQLCNVKQEKELIHQKFLLTILILTAKS